MQVVRRDLRIPAVGVVIAKKNLVIDSYQAEVAVGDTTLPRTDTIRLVRGDTVYVLNYLALGQWRWAHHGQLHTSDEFWAAAPDQGLGAPSLDSTLAVARTSPESDDWWLVQPRQGAPGWWHGDSHPELQSIFGMQHRGDDCDQVRRRARAPRDGTR